MDDSLHIIRALYADDDDASPTSDEDAFRARLADDETLRAEFEELQAVKAVLDRRPPSRPSTRVVDDVVAAAGRAARGEPVDASDSADRAAKDRAAKDRAALNGSTVPAATSGRPTSDRSRGERPRSERSRSERPRAERSPQSHEERSLSSRLTGVRKLGAGLAALLIVVVGVWQLTPVSSSLPDDPATTQADASSAETDAATSTRADRATRSGRSLPAWDEGDEVVRLQRRLELIRARSPATQWSGFQPASQTMSP